MPQTPNHGYNVPSEGEEDWHEPLNENFERYDTDIEIRDVLDNRSDYEPREGAKFLATDTEDVYLGDGEHWTTVHTSGTWPRFERVFIDGSDRAPRIEYELADAGTAMIQGLTQGRYVTSLFDDSGDQFSALSATRDGTRRIGLGTASPATPVDVAGQNNWNLDSGDGDLRVGNDDYRLAIGVSLGGVGRGTSRLRAKGGTEQLKLGAGSSDAVTVRAGSVSVDGDLDVSGDKSFVQSVDTDAGEREVVYSASEAGTARTEASGVAELDDGRAEVALPEHFAWVTDAGEPLVVQTTPYGGERGLKVVERSTERIVVEALAGEGDYEFAYTVKGTRDGFADREVVREPTAEPAGGTVPTPADD